MRKDMHQFSRISFTKFLLTYEMVRTDKKIWQNDGFAGKVVRNDKLKCCDLDLLFAVPSQNTSKINACRKKY